MYMYTWGPPDMPAARRAYDDLRSARQVMTKCKIHIHLVLTTSISKSPFISSKSPLISSWPPASQVYRAAKTLFQPPQVYRAAKTLFQAPQVYRAAKTLFQAPQVYRAAKTLIDAFFPSVKASSPTHSILTYRCMHTYMYKNYRHGTVLILATSTYIHTYIHTHIHTHIHTYISSSWPPVHTYINTYIHTCPHLGHQYIHTYTHTYIHVLILATSISTLLRSKIQINA